MKWKHVQNGGQCPLPRSSHTLTAIDSNLYLFGGENVPRTPIDSRLFCYDLGSEHWEEVKATGTAPSPRVGHSATALNGKLYVFGGRNGIEMGEGSVNDLWCFDPETSSWTEIKPQAALPPARSFHTMATAGDSIFIFGGCGQSGRLNDLWQYNTKLNTWEQLPSSPHIQGRGGSALVAATTDALYVICGFCGTEISDTHKYNISTGQWDCPTCCIVDGSATLAPRSMFASGAHGCTLCPHPQNQHIVLFGGEVDPSTQGHAGAGKFSNDVYCLDVGAKEVLWNKLSVQGTPPIARGWCASTSVPEGLVIHGGIQEDNQRLGDMHLLMMHEE